MCRRMKKKYIRLIIIFIIAVLLNIMAWLGPVIDEHTHMGNWCDFYADHITGIWVNTYARFMDIFPFSVGEIMLTLAVLLILALVLSVPFFIVLKIKKKNISRLKRFYLICGYITGIVSIIMTLNCTILYHVTPMDGNPQIESRNYSVDELEKLRNYLVEKCNELCVKFERDEKNAITNCEFTQAEIKDSLRSLSKKYGRLSGYYPDVKPMFYSRLMTQAYTMGYYFPFSMEANYNKLLYSVNIPSTLAHELAHIKGYIYEDEASFIGFLACINSENEFIQYSGYLDVLAYVNKAYCKSLNKDDSRYRKQPVFSEQLKTDYYTFVGEDVWKDIREKAVLDTEFVNNVSNSFTETSLNLNGVDDGMASYDRVVDLLLQYYDGVLY